MVWPTNQRRAARHAHLSVVGLGQGSVLADDCPEPRPFARSDHVADIDTTIVGRVVRQVIEQLREAPTDEVTLLKRRVVHLERAQLLERLQQERFRREQRLEQERLRHENARFRAEVSERLGAIERACVLDADQPEESAGSVGELVDPVLLWINAHVVEAREYAGQFVAVSKRDGSLLGRDADFDALYERMAEHAGVVFGKLP
jgi:hypothetical protein